MLANSGSLNHAQIFGSIEREESSQDSEDSFEVNPNPNPSDDADDDDFYVPQQSKLVTRVNKKKHIIKNGGDGDIWVEAKVIVDNETGRTRSYFYSKNTQEKVWDEPPSGARRVVYLRDVKRAYLREKTHRWQKTFDEENKDRRNIHRALNLSSGTRQKSFYHKTNENMIF